MMVYIWGECEGENDYMHVQLIYQYGNMYTSTKIAASLSCTCTCIIFFESEQWSLHACMCIVIVCMSKVETLP